MSRGTGNRGTDLSLPRVPIPNHQKNPVPNTSRKPVSVDERTSPITMAALEREIKQLKLQLTEKDREIHELKQQVRDLEGRDRTPRFTRSMGVSAEPHVPGQPTSYAKVAKTPSTEKLINQAIQGNEFMKKLEIEQIKQIIDCMHRIDYRQSDVIIREGDFGSLVYALEEGTVEVSNKTGNLCTLGPGKIFGELAILYNCTRTATVKALSACKLWAIDRHLFQSVMMKTGMETQKHHVNFLKSAAAFKSLDEHLLNKIADELDEVQYRNGEYIIRQGEKGDTFFILSRGKVKVTKNDPTSGEEHVIAELNEGQFFGELALEKEEVRSANVVANDPGGVTCLVLEREPYRRLLMKHNYKRITPPSDEDDQSRAINQDNGSSPIDAILSNLTLKDVEVHATLGIGGFGRVELVTIGDSKKVFARKKLSKKHIVETRQQEHLVNEINIMGAARSDFISRLYGTMKDAKYIYLYLEPCLGGELWTLLRNKNNFDDTTTRFYTGCVVEAYSYLHKLNIIYRDLKPENLLLDRFGYIKLVDFGFAKRIGHGQKTWTFCGTPEYVAPEIILNKGHDLAADLWSLGILIYELHTGSPPFSGSDHMKTYNFILRGIDTVEFPRRFNKNAQRIVKQFCRDNPTERLGYGVNGLKDVQKHKWFDGFNWEGLRRRKLVAPILPTVRSSIDSSNFDNFPKDEGPEPPDDTTGWDKDF